jgi:GTP pyrophosphokinase
MYSKALAFAYNAHAGQKRSDGRPYITHPISVAACLMKCNPYPSDEEIQAALNHDSVEDCGVTYQELKQYFGATVAYLVDELTNIYTAKDWPDLTRKERKAREHSRIGRISKEAIRIKLLDGYDNLSDMDGKESPFIKLYSQETLNLLEFIPDDIFYAKQKAELWVLAVALQIKK